MAKSAEVKLAIFGRAGVGKSALVVRFLTKRFIWEYDPTLESTYRHQATIDDEVVSMEILDTAGQVRGCVCCSPAPWLGCAAGRKLWCWQQCPALGTQICFWAEPPLSSPVLDPHPSARVPTWKIKQVKWLTLGVKLFCCHPFLFRASPMSRHKVTFYFYSRVMRPDSFSP
uniref:small monomeric GTPase n=1 Tax=Ficedula albicollis TaxID=59894 RepID=A0A803WFX9_FICAL